MANLSARVMDAAPPAARAQPSAPRNSATLEVPSGSSSTNEFWDRFCVKPRRKLSLQRPVSSQRDCSPRVRYPKAMDALKKVTQVPLTFATMERKWLLPLMASTIISVVLLLLATFSMGSTDSTGSIVLPDAGNSQNALEIVVVEDSASELPPPPRLAYLISGTKGDGQRMQRTLQALYHPRNYYLLHLDLEAPPRERLDLARYVKNEIVFQENGNVYVVGKANLVTYRGPTMIAATLHGAAILLRKAKDWDWFINLSAADYPLVTQDGTSFALFFVVICS